MQLNYGIPSPGMIGPPGRIATYGLFVICIWGCEIQAADTAQNAAFVGGLVKSPAKSVVDAEVGKSNCWWVLLVLPRNAVHSCSDMGRVLDVFL